MHVFCQATLTFIIIWAKAHDFLVMELNDYLWINLEIANAGLSLIVLDTRSRRDALFK